MKRTIKLFIFWILIYIPIVISLVVFTTNRSLNTDTPEKYVQVQKYIGKRFEFKNLLDRKNNKVNLESSTDITLVDFWYSGCLPCVKEMREFNALISGKKKEINIVSISIDSKEYWERSFQENSPLSFLREETSNWKHYNLTDSTFLMVEKKLVARGSGLDFTKELGLIAFPSYLVLNKNGVLIELPNSGVDYIRENLYNQSYFRIFWTSPQIRDIAIKMFIGVFVLYSLIYWLIILILLLIRRYRKNSKVANNAHKSLGV